MKERTQVQTWIKKCQWRLLIEDFWPHDSRDTHKDMMTCTMTWKTTMIQWGMKGRHSLNYTSQEEGMRIRWGRLVQVHSIIRTELEVLTIYRTKVNSLHNKLENSPAEKFMLNRRNTFYTTKKTLLLVLHSDAVNDIMNPYKREVLGRPLPITFSTCRIWTDKQWWV